VKQHASRSESHEPARVARWNQPAKHKEKTRTDSLRFSAETWKTLEHGFGIGYNDAKGKSVFGKF
jgi:hypothetical protein